MYVPSESLATDPDASVNYSWGWAEGGLGGGVPSWGAFPLLGL